MIRVGSRKCGEIAYSPPLKIAISCARSMSKTGTATSAGGERSGAIPAAISSAERAASLAAMARARARVVLLIREELEITSTSNPLI